MKLALLSLVALWGSVVLAAAAVGIDEAAFGKSLGGWSKRDKQVAEYPLSGATYRTYKPEASPTPEGGLFISVRIDHVRGWLSSDDHAILEVTLNARGMIVCARSNIAIQGRSITSDMILGGNEAGKQLLGADRAVQIGTELVADLSAKLLREKIVEAGRVSFPAALRHNYNLLFQAIRVEDDARALPVPAEDSATPAAVKKPAAPEPAKQEPAKPEPARPEPAKPEPAAPSAAPEPIKETSKDGVKDPLKEASKDAPQAAGTPDHEHAPLDIKASVAAPAAH